MKAAIKVLFKCSGKRGVKRVQEIDEEFGFHLEMLAHTYIQKDLTTEEAKEAAQRRFGDVERIKNECLDIKRRRQPFFVALKSLLSVMFLAGLVLRVLKMDANIHHLGDLLIAVPVLSSLLLYVRSLDPSRFLSTPRTSPLRLNETGQSLFTAYDQGMRTPVERLISDD